MRKNKKLVSGAARGGHLTVDEYNQEGLNPVMTAKKR